MNTEYDSYEDAIQDKKLLIQENIESIKEHTMKIYYSSLEWNSNTNNTNLQVMNFCVSTVLIYDKTYMVDRRLKPKFKENREVLEVPIELREYTMLLLKQYDDVLLELI